MSVSREEMNTAWCFIGVLTLSVLTLCAMGITEKKPEPTGHPMGLAERAHMDGYIKGLKEGYTQGYLDGRMYELNKRLQENDYPCNPCVGDK